LQPFDILRTQRLETEITGTGEKGMEYDLKAMDVEIKAIEERAKKLKELGKGFEAVERNADSILTFVFLLKRNISDLVE
jgi:hypothetical protein